MSQVLDQHAMNTYIWRKQSLKYTELVWEPGFTWKQGFPYVGPHMTPGKVNELLERK